MRKIILLLLALLLVIPSALAQTESGGDSVQVRVGHFSADAPEVDVYVDGELAAGGLAYAEVTPWLELEAGTYEVAVTPAGEPVDAAVIGPASYELAAGDWVTIAVIGLVGNNTLDAQVIVEDYGTMEQGMARVGVFHAVPDLGLVNVELDSEMLFMGLDYPGTFAGSDGFVEADIVAGSYNFVITDEAGDTLLETGSVTLGEGRQYFIGVIGTAANPDFVLYATDGAGDAADADAMSPGEGPLLARAAHLATGAPAVDIYLNGERAVRDLGFAEFSDYVELEAGTYEVAVVPAGDGLADAVYSDEVVLQAGGVFTLAAIGVLELDTLTVDVVSQNPQAEEGLARVSLYHAIPAAGEVNLLVDGEVVIEGLSYPEAFAGADGYFSVDLTPGSRELAIQSADGTTIVDVGTIEMGAGRHYFVAAIGTAIDPDFVIEAADVATVTP